MKKKRFDSGAILIYLVLFFVTFYPAICYLAVAIGIDTGKLRTTESACTEYEYYTFKMGRSTSSIPVMKLHYADGVKVKTYFSDVVEAAEAYRDEPAALQATYVTSWRGMDECYWIVALQDKNTGQYLFRLDDAKEWYWSSGRTLGIIGLILAGLHTLILYGDKILDWQEKRQQEKTRQKNRARREEQKQRRAQLMAEQSDSAEGDAKVHAKPDPNASKKKRKRR